MALALLRSSRRVDTHSGQSPDAISAISPPTVGHASQRLSVEVVRSPSSDQEAWSSDASTFVNTSPEVIFQKDDGGSQPYVPLKKEDSPRNAITITIPLPWGKKSSRRSSSVPASTERRRREESRTRLEKSPRVPWVQSTRASPTLSRDAPNGDASIKSTITPRDDEKVPSWNPDTRSQATGSLKSAASLKTTSPALKVLSPVVERFEKTASASTSIDVSPATPIDPSVQFPMVTRAAPILVFEEVVVRKPVYPNIEFGVPLANHPTMPNGRSASRTSNRSQRAPSLSATDTKIRSPQLLDQSRRRGASVDHHTRRRQSQDARRDSGSTAYSSSTGVLSDDESLPGSLDDRYFESRKMWNGRAGAGQTGFYRHVVDDYKMIAKDVGAADLVYARSSPKLSQHEFTAALDSKLSIVEAGQELVPTAEDLWG